MESLWFIIGFLALFYFGYFLFSPTKKRRRRTPVQKTPKLPQASSGPAPFDVTSSTLQVGDRVLSGRAYVVDGDTIVIQGTQIRLFGVDAPEMSHPFGKKAKWALVSLCKGKTVSAKVVATDAHGRTVAECCLEDGSDLSAEMVKLGLALDWPKFSGGKYRALETPDARRKLWLADARQKGRMHVWENFENRRGQSGN